jgi:hypothetical protein
MCEVAARFKSVIDELKYETNFKLTNQLHLENTYLTHEELNTSIKQAEHRWRIHLISCNIVTSRAKGLSNRQLFY